MAGESSGISWVGMEVLGQDVDRKIINVLASIDKLNTDLKPKYDRWKKAFFDDVLLKQRRF